MKHLFGTGNSGPRRCIPLFLFCMLFLPCACNMSGGQQSALYATPSASMKQAAAGMDYDSVQVEAAMDRHRSEYPSEVSGETSPLQSGENSVQSRKLVKKAELNLRVEDPGATEKPLAELMEKYGAWPASTGIYENSRSYTIRVPSPSYDTMLSELAGLGKMLRRTENAEDVTLNYYDLESRLATKRELLKTFQSYLGKAKNIDEIMTVESRIADLQQDIDRTGTQFRNLANLVDYSTINLQILGPVSASSYSEPTLGERLKELFGSFSEVASQALVVLMGIVIYGVPAILILIVLFWVLFGRIGILKKIWRIAAGKK